MSRRRRKRHRKKGGAIHMIEGGKHWRSSSPTHNFKEIERVCKICGSTDVSIAMQVWCYGTDAHRHESTLMVPIPGGGVEMGHKTKDPDRPLIGVKVSGNGASPPKPVTPKIITPIGAIGHTQAGLPAMMARATPRWMAERVKNLADWKPVSDKGQIDLFSLGQDAILDWMLSLLKGQGYTAYRYDNFLYAEGNIPVLLVAHADTVFDGWKGRRRRVELLKGEVKGEPHFWSPDGLGGDDRAGIWAVMHLTDGKQKPYVLLTTDEERGLLGAREATEFLEVPPVQFIIEVDRRGEKDAVFYQCSSKEYHAYIESFGFKRAEGSTSDIRALMRAWKICGVNLSIGYKNEHSREETVNLSHWRATVDNIKKIFAEKHFPSFGYEEYAYGGGYGYGESEAHVSATTYCKSCNLSLLQSETRYGLCLPCIWRIAKATQPKADKKEIEVVM